MDCQKLYKDIEKLKSLRDKLSDELEKSTETGLGNAALSAVSEEASNVADEILGHYVKDMIEQNINDKEGRNSEFLNTILAQYIRKDEEDTSLQRAFINLPDTINKVRDNLEQCIKSDPRLGSNLVVYALKEKLDNSDYPLKDLEELYKDIIPETIKDKTLPKLAYLYNIAERVKNLETLETKSYIFMLPKDKWEKGKIKLPGENPNFIAPHDLTAILKEPVYYDWSYETDGQKTDSPTLVYDGRWVGKEIHHFPWSKELIREANEKLLKPNGYHIPERDEWKNIYDDLKAKYGDDDSAISLALREDLNLAFSNFVNGGDFKRVGCGCFLSASKGSGFRASILYLNDNRVSPGEDNWLYWAQSVRCVS